MTSLRPTGVKAVFEKAPSVRQLQRLERAIQVYRNRLERWLTRKYRAMLAEVRDTLAEIDAPTDEDFQLVVFRFRHEQETVLRQLYSQLYPWASSLAIDDEKLKSAVIGMETKEVDTVDAQMRAWVEQMLGLNISYICDDTLASIRRMYADSDGDVEAFRQSLMSSGTFGDVRARRIAVTETTSGINHAIHETSRVTSNGRRMKTTWHTTGGWNVRETHREMNGVSVPFGQLFHVPRADGGIDLMAFPGDSSHGASAGNVVNCHCVAFNVYDD